MNTYHLRGLWRAVDKVAEILFPNVPKFSGNFERKDVN